MFGRLSRLAALLALSAAPIRHTLAQPFSDEKAGDKAPQYVSARMVADVSAILPGRPFHLGVELNVEKDWHVYWKYSGDTGKPTEVHWRLPQGFEPGPLNYPAPHKFVDAGDVVSFGHTGRVLLWSEITPPADLERGKEASLSADVSWLACKTLCVIGGEKVSLHLPVAAPAGQAKPANAVLFETARRQAPVPADRAEHVRVRTGLNVDRVRPGDRFEAGLHLTIERGWHLQSHRPLGKGLIATDLFLGGPETISLDRPVFPPGKVREFLGEKVSEYTGGVLIRVPARATDDLKPGQLIIEGVLVVQACSEAGACLPPQYIAVRIPVTAVAAGAGVAPANADWFAAGTAPAPEVGSSQPVASHGASSDEGAASGLGLVLLFAFLGGLVLNVMPCVLPVISIKIVSFVQQAGESPRRVLILGLSFAAGMLVFFLLLGVLAMMVKIGPGWILQRPSGVILLIAVIFGFALSLFGVFDVRLPGSAATRLGTAGTREGPVGALAKGFLTTILGTSCTAPFLSYAWAAALTAGPFARLLIFATMGIGMALPYMILSARPGWLRFLPKPGPWMDGFKQFMGFFLVATVLWLLWVLAGHAGSEGVILALGFMTLLAIALWMVGRVPLTASARRSLLTHAVASVLVVAGVWLTIVKVRAVSADKPTVAAATPGSSLPEALDFSTSIPWQPYAPGLAEEIAAAGKIVYVDYTARWCLTCQTNKRAVLETDEIRSAMQRMGVVPIKADFSRQSPEIEKDLARFGRPSVPLNLVYRPAQPDDPIVLPELLTKSLVIRALKQAASSNSAVRAASASARSRR